MHEQLINALRVAIKSDDYDRIDEVESRIVQEGNVMSSMLAKMALEFDPEQRDNYPTQHEFNMARTALGLIGEIGSLDEELVDALFDQFLKGRNSAEVNRQGWRGVWGTAVHTFKELGYELGS